ncbi:retrovirus-related pol polyprotein from transposon TNT 1-94 [Tanacetum coccineum]
MAAGSRDRPPMLATGRYAEWQSRFLRYIDTRPIGDALRKCILEAVETLLTMSSENKAHYESKKEAIHLLLTGIGDEIYLTINAFKTAHEIWIAIEKLQQGESLNIQDVKTNLFWEFGKFTSHDEESMESYYSRFYKMMNEMIRNNLTVATLQVNVQFLQQLQPEWSRSNASTKFKGKEIAKLITPPSESASKEDNDPEQAQRDKDMQKNLVLIAKYFKNIYKPTKNNLRTSSNSKNKNVDTTLRYKNDNQTGQFGNQRTVTVAGARETVGMQETKKVKDSTYHKEKMLWCKQAEKAIGTVEKVDSNVILDSPDMCDNDIQTNQNAVECDDERVEVPTADSGTDTEPLEQTDQNAEDERAALANLIANLKLDVDENKRIKKQLKKANASLAHELKECKSILAETSKTLRESNSIRDRVIHKTNVSRPQLRSTQMKDKVVPNNSQVKDKKTEVEDHPRISSISNKTKSVTVCNDNLKSRTSNVNVVCATCGKCVFNLNHNVCVSIYLNDVNARTKKPKVVPISTRKPKSQSNKSVATPPKKTIVQLILFIVDSRCTKNMTGNLKLLCNFVKKYLGTVHFGNDQFALILGYEDLVQGNITINRIYYVEGLNHNLFSVGQFCNADLEVAFRKSTCFVRDLQGNDLLTAWLWHRRLSHLNFDYINLLSKKDVMIGLPKLKHVKDQLCSSCEVSKAKRSSFKTKAVPSLNKQLNLLHMDLCGPMRVASINGKKYILVIVDDYSRYTWTLFLSSKDETPEVLKDFLIMI